MNKKFIWIIVILLIAVIIFARCFSDNTSKEEFKPLDINVGDEFTGVSYPNSMYVVNYEVADITGDAEKDMILLVGENSSGETISNTEVNNMDVLVFDTIENKFIKADSKKLIGKNNRIIISDFTGDQIMDIMIISDYNNKLCIRIYAYESGKLNEIWKEKNNKGLIFNGEFLDGFKGKVINRKLNFEKTIDFNNKKDSYIEMGLYNSSGKLKDNPNKFYTSGFITAEVVKLNDRYGIRTIQRIYGNNEQDIIDEIETIWKYNDGKWQMVESKGLKLGNLLY